MNAHKFVAEKGIDEAKRVLKSSNDAWAYDSNEDYFFDGSDLQDGYSIEHCNGCFLVEELKQVVESVDYLNEWYEGKIDDAYDHVERMHGMLKLKPQFPNLHSRIKLVEGHLADYELVEYYKENHHV